MIEIVNKKYYRYSGDLTSTYEVYIGRNGKGSVLQNNYIISQDGTRAEVIEKYKKDLKERYLKDAKTRGYLNALSIIAQHLTLVLVCHCKPLPCHGDVVKECLESIIKNDYWK